MKTEEVKRDETGNGVVTDVMTGGIARTGKAKRNAIKSGKVKRDELKRNVIKSGKVKKDELKRNVVKRGTVKRGAAGRNVLAAAGLLLSVLWISPFYLVLVNSFKTKKELFAGTLNLPKTLQLSNYSKAAADLMPGESFKNTILITFFSIILIVVFSSMAAYALQRVKRRSSTVVFLGFTAAMLIPFQAVMIPLVAEFSKFRLLNMPGILLMYLGFGCSLGIFLYHGALKGIPVSLDESALIDGCSRLRLFWKIIFPMIKPATVTVAVLDIMWIWNDYLLPSLVINKTGMRTVQLMIFYFFGQYTRQWHLAMAGLTIAMAPVLVFFFLAQKQIVRGIISGAVKQ